MTSSELQDARQLLDTLEEALDPQRLRETIEAPMEDAAERFLQRGTRPASCEQFNQQITDFVTNVYSSASQGKRLFPQAEAFALGVQALDETAGLPDRRSYEIALLSVVRDGSQEMNAVLATILEGLKQRERTAYFRWVCARFLEPLDWRKKCLLAETVLQVHRETTGAELLNGDPTRFAGDLPDLVAAYVEAAQAAQKTAPTGLKR